MEPIITRREGGEYSTVLLPSNIVETIWFGNDGSSRVVGRTVIGSIAALAREHVEFDEGSRD